MSFSSTKSYLSQAESIIHAPPQPPFEAYTSVLSQQKKKNLNGQMPQMYLLNHFALSTALLQISPNIQRKV